MWELLFWVFNTLGAGLCIAMEPVAVIFDRRQRRAFVRDLEARSKVGPLALQYWPSVEEGAWDSLTPEEEEELEKRFVPLGRGAFARNCKARVLDHMWNKLVVSGRLSSQDVKLLSMLQASLRCRCCCCCSFSR